MHTYFLIWVLIFSFEGYSQTQPPKEVDSLHNFLNNNKRFKINPSIDCYSVDTCFIKHEKINLFAIRSVSENDSKKYVSNNIEFSINTLPGNEEHLTIDNREFPDYKFSEYYLIENKLYVINTIPFCTGIACKYRYAQIFDLEYKILYEKKISWDK